MKVSCGFCGRTYEASSGLENAFREWRSRRLRYGRLTCEKCGKNGPLDIRAARIHQPVAGPPPNQYRCPVSHCDGWVEHVKWRAKKIWRCGECGGEWATQADLFAHLEAVMKRYPYRKKVYRRVKDGWESVKLTEEPSNYEERVYKEPFEDEPHLPRTRAKPRA